MGGNAESSSPAYSERRRGQENENHKKAASTGHFSQSEHDAILLHVAFAIVAAVTLLSSPPESLGPRIWSLIIGWYTSVITTALQRNHTHWLKLLRFLSMISIFFVIPDGFLVKGLKTIHFPDIGVGQIFGVSSFMAFMWAIPLFLSTLVGMGMEERGAGMYQAAWGSGITSLIVMGGSELVLTRIPIWYALGNCSTVGQHAAIYVLVPECCLGMVVFLGWKYIVSLQGQVSFIVQLYLAFLIMCSYLGNLIVWYMILDGDKL